MSSSWSLSFSVSTPNAGSIDTAKKCFSHEVDSGTSPGGGENIAGQLVGGVKMWRLISFTSLGVASARAFPRLEVGIKTIHQEKIFVKVSKMWGGTTAAERGLRVLEGRRREPRPNSLENAV